MQKNDEGMKLPSKVELRANKEVVSNRLFIEPTTECTLAGVITSEH